MITVNGIVGLSLVVGAFRRSTVSFNAEGTGSALATVATLAGLSLVLPMFTQARKGPPFSPGQLTFAALASLVLYGLLVLTQTVSHRDFFLPLHTDGTPLGEDEHRNPPSTGTAVCAARGGRMQSSMNLALGSAMASIGLMIPVIAVATIWISGPLELGLGATRIVLLALTVVVSLLTIVPGRATRLEGGVHLVLLAAFVFLSVNP